MGSQRHRRISAVLLLSFVLSCVSAGQSNPYKTSYGSVTSSTQSSTTKSNYGSGGKSSTKSNYGSPASTTSSYAYGSQSSTSSYGYQSSGSSMSAVNLPRKPAPAPGQSEITENSYTSTSGLPYDFFTGMSLRQLDVVRTQAPLINQEAARLANTTADQGPFVYGAIVDYILSLWFPEDAKKVGLPFNRNGTDGGGQLQSTETFWTSSEARVISTAYGRRFAAGLSHILDFDSIGYARVEDDTVYTSYLQLRAYGQNLGDVISLYLHDTIVQTGAIDYVYGSGFTDEIHSAFKTVFRFINWHQAAAIDLYQRMIYKRFEGPENDSCASISPLDLVPAYQDYPTMSNNTAMMMQMMQYGSYSGNNTGPVNPDGTPKKHGMDSVGMGRQYTDQVPAGQDYQTQSSQTSSSQNFTSSDFFGQPKQADGATPLSPPPYSATAGKNVDSFSGISYDQLATALEAWKNVTKAAAAASGVPESDGAKVFGKLSYYIFIKWHSEYSAITNYQSPEDIWTNVTLDAGFASVTKDLDNQIIGIVQNNPAMAVRLIDKTAFNYYMQSRTIGESWYTLPFFAWTTDSGLEAAKYLMGDDLSDEAYSALESVFSFLYLKTYQVYHSYIKEYRQRPFADDWELIGGTLSLNLNFGLGVGVVFDAGAGG